MDSMKITILDDGSIKVETDKISAANHMSADKFMEFLRTAGGAPQERKHKHGRIGAALHALQHAAGKAHHHTH